MLAYAHHVLDAAYAAGIRYFEAAPSYGKAEAFLTSWLEARRRQSAPHCDGRGHAGVLHGHFDDRAAARQQLSRNRTIFLGVRHQKAAADPI
jgi:hypothetical protein